MLPILNIHSHFSLLLSTIQPKKLPALLKKREIDCAAITDIGNLSGTVQFYKELTAAGIKPILGETFSVVRPDGECDKVIVLTKNKAGWLELIRLNSLANSESHFDHKPLLFIDDLKSFANGNLFVISDAVQTYFNIFQDDFRVAIYGFTRNVDKLRAFAWEKKLKAVALTEPYYMEQQDAVEHRIILATRLKTVIKNLEKRASELEPELLPFLHSTKYYIPTYKEIEEYFTEEEIQETHSVANACESYDILSKPQLPDFPCPNNKSDNEYLIELCRQGWKERLNFKQDDQRYKEYGDRTKYELGVIKDANLAGYFLIVQDILRFVREKGWLPGLARGSAAGCLVSYLIRITSVDPIKYNLLFERFYNAGRKGTLPDIDIDIPLEKRTEIIEYIKNKYGHDKVAQMITFQTIKGKAAIKDVLRADGSFSFDEINRITEHIEDEAKIADELQEMKEEEGESSIIKWALENKAEKFKEWVHLDDKGNVCGPLAVQFSMAMRREGIKSAASKHAAGVIVAPYVLNENCPMSWDTKTKTQIVGLEMNEAEAVGLVKMDVLSIVALDKVMMTCKEVENTYVV